MSCSSGSTPVSNHSGAADPVRPRYQLVPIEKAGVALNLKLPGTLAAYQEVSIFPKVNGYVKAIPVDIGSRVNSGNLLMVLEAPELEQSALAAREKYAHAKADYQLDKERYHRLLEASATEGAVSPLDLSTWKSKMEADSALSNAALNTWKEQEVMMSYLKVISPFSGVITERNVHPGALVSSAEKNVPLIVLKQIDKLRLQVDVPEGLASTLHEGDTISFYTSAFPGKKMLGHVSRLSRNISVQLRSERIEMDVDNRKGNLAPGMYADVVIHSRGSGDAFTVPRSAIVTTTERKFIVAVRQGKAVRINVMTGNMSDGRAEIYGDIMTGDKVVVNPADDIREGDPLEKG
jgi:RND family efflux transporter MFP subunit